MTTATLSQPTAAAPRPSHRLARRPATDRLPALCLVGAPHRVRRFALAVLLLLVLTPVVLLFVPWRQSLPAAGKVVAFDPAERRQLVEAPLAGRVQKWHVVEGQEVKGPTLARVTILKPEDVVVVGDISDLKYGALEGRTIEVEVFDDEDQKRREKRTLRKGDRLVVEERVVAPGTPLVSLRDANDNQVNDLAEERKAVQRRRDEARKRAESLDGQIASLREAQKEAIGAAESRRAGAEKRLDGARQGVLRAEAERAAAENQFEIQDGLLKERLTPGTVWIEAKRRKEGAEAALAGARAAVAEAEDNVAALRADLARVRRDTEAAIQGVTALRQQAEADAYSAQRDLVQVKVRQRRQETQDVTAPCDGTVLQIVANAAAGSAYVKDGDALLVIVPRIADAKDRRQVVELYLDGNDAPQLTYYWDQERRRTGLDVPPLPVRLALEGWPALQWVGWPSLAVGTFPGRVVFVDRHADAKGKFRILVEPDADAIANGDAAWPDDFQLRQGARVNGFVLLNEVTLGWEMWRQLNGFPPVVADKDGDDKPAKEAKPKLPK